MDLILLAASNGSETWEQKEEKVREERQRGGTSRSREFASDFRLTIDLVEEDDTRLASSSLLEQQPQLTLGLSDPLAQTIGSLPHEERCRSQRQERKKRVSERLASIQQRRERLTDLGSTGAATSSESSGDERLSCSRRTVEKNTSRRGDLESEEELGVEERERDHLLELLDVWRDIKRGERGISSRSIRRGKKNRNSR